MTTHAEIAGRFAEEAGKPGAKRSAQGLQEDLIAKEKELKEANERIALLQKNVLDRQRWATREELRLAIITWIERTYHRRRRQRRLGRLTPVEYETLNLAATAA